mmetsp:Transcript_9008/g.15246  ORF Transcript_9008/g.15246 Transcript_9008/m.15246 type:complete len:788 (+) Transcript_9008:149-2512(+)|eukprot:CAMPEP_0114422724 /NCGR_PEP_ID=MMETSP0103-20121206/5763_1 /TAXON_ID=37642 ORGANISM="Paraphysomonas imperforata, Strain PA2" /NCGR_SAMPLE_ID=MMETSP0103 /ASSEMBLY_ACC=CAM_ASM_000201 /LENGTH=787 /DNA_ID=CAMNT_0001591329 /DNA_START=131 /DNA_END=2494 /DNA_ORIENTATION=+
MTSTHATVSTSESAIGRPAAVNFSEFLHKETSPVVFTIINAFNSLFGVIQFASYLISGAEVLFLIPAVLRLLLIIPLNIYQCRLKTTEASDNRIPSTILGDAIILLFTFANGLNLVVFAYGKCDSPFCPDYEGEMPTGPLLGYFMQLLCMIFVIKSHHSLTAWVAICCQAAFSIVLASRMNQDASFFVGLSLTLIFEGLIVFDYKRYLHRSYVTMIEIEVTVRAQVQAEQNRKLEENKSAEMRYLFGNVAHDLKTPLQSFSLELETLQHVANEVIKKPSDTAAMKLSNISTQVEESVDMLNSVCSFMLMTINRAIDHAKTTSGISLVPKYEVMSVSHSLNWVCKRIGKSELAPMVVAPISDEVNDLVITDQQWFRENLLCLVSNAHKFNCSGSVKISCGLVTPSTLKNDDSAVASSHHLLKRCASSTDGILSELSTVKSHSGYGVVGDVDVPLSSPSPAHNVDIETGFCHDHDMEMSHVMTSPSTYFSNSPAPLASEKMLLIEVEDSGEGIPAERRLALFKPFQQAQRGAGGTGLGLYSLSNRIAALGGVCGVSNRKDGKAGSRFWFAFPYFPGEMSTLPLSFQNPPLLPGARKELEVGVGNVKEEVIPSPTKNPVSRPRVHLSRLEEKKTEDLAETTSSTQGWSTELPSHVLLVEDSLMIQKATIRAFQRKNIKIDVAVNGAEGLLKLKSKAYSLVLMDIQMPTMDGLEAVKHIRELKYDTDLTTNVTGKNAMVIGVSASSDCVSEKEALDAGMNGFFAKPLSLHKLQHFLEALKCPLVPSMEAEV